jgi:hypothetical protein
VPSKNTTIDTRWNAGIFNFTKIRIPKGVTVTVIGPSPAFLHSQGLVQIDGVLTASARGQVAGPGGGLGGASQGGYGAGPGGGRGTKCPTVKAYGGGGGAGHATAGTNGTGCNIQAGGRSYGSVFPVDLTAGSGGGGGYYKNGVGGVGGGGGGFLAILSSGGIKITGTVSADGAPGTASSGSQGGGGGGSGGKILLRSIPLLSITGSLTVDGKNGASLGGAGGVGYIRVDGYGIDPAWTAVIKPWMKKSRLPDLSALSDPKIGTTMKLRVVALPGDTVLLAAAAKVANINFPPFGFLKIDPATLLVYGIKKATGGLDGIATFDVPVPNDPKLLGATVHWQALNTITMSKRPLLTNALITTVK